MVRSRLGFHIGFATDLDSTPAPSLALAVLLRVDQVCVCVRRWKRRCGAPGRATVVTSLDRIQPAAWALLRHAVWTSVWAQGESLLLLLPNPLLLFLAMVSDPCWSGPVSQARRACFVVPLLLDAWLAQLSVLVLSM
jgi:hypothetical protein